MRYNQDKRISAREDKSWVGDEMVNNAVQVADIGALLKWLGAWTVGQIVKLAKFTYLQENIWCELWLTMYPWYLHDINTLKHMLPQNQGGRGRLWWPARRTCSGCGGWSGPPLPLGFGERIRTAYPLLSLYGHSHYKFNQTYTLHIHI